MSGRPFKYCNDEDRLNAAKEQRRASYERNKDKYAERANLRAKRSYYKRKINDTTDEAQKQRYIEMLNKVNELLQ